MMLYVGKQEALGKDELQVWASKWGLCAYLLFLREKAASWGVARVCAALAHER